MPTRNSVLTVLSALQLVNTLPSDNSNIYSSINSVNSNINSNTESYRSNSSLLIEKGDSDACKYMTVGDCNYDYNRWSEYKATDATYWKCNFPIIPRLSVGRLIVRIDFHFVTLPRSYREHLLTKGLWERKKRNFFLFLNLRFFMNNKICLLICILKSRNA